MEKKVKVSGIVWDTDGEDVNLPETVIIDDETIYNSVVEDNTGYMDEIADWLSDHYDWCVMGFDACVIAE